MNFNFDKSLLTDYTNSSQQIRVMSENWFVDNVFCPCCGNSHLAKEDNNKPVADFKCELCGRIFELKSKGGKLGNKVADGAYKTMIERITSITNPDLFILRYVDYIVQDLMIIPRFFFSPQIIEMRSPLSKNARRANWIGCNILLSQIPLQGRISVIENQQVRPKEEVVKEYKIISTLEVDKIKKRGWLLEILNCVNKIGKSQFTLSEVYAFVDELQIKYPDNHRIEAKIRQQLQFLRNKGMIEFMGKATYRMIKFEELF